LRLLWHFTEAHLWWNWQTHRLEGAALSPSIWVQVPVGA